MISFLSGIPRSHKYHYPECKIGKRTKNINIRIFSSAEEALLAGYEPCKICKPPTYEPKEIITKTAELNYGKGQ
jgi:methylphosphotriester-DNA--protein-cysteine methyltransferase